jgi:cell wall-associated NlpC family hydrolase
MPTMRLLALIQRLLTPESLPTFSFSGHANPDTARVGVSPIETVPFVIDTAIGPSGRKGGQVGRVVVAVVAGCVVFAVLLGGCVAALNGTDSTASTPSGPGAGHQDGPAVPAAWEMLDQNAAATWAVLAAIGRVESDSGRSGAPGVASGANYAGAEGPMQFEPATFAEFGVVGPGGANPPSPYDPVDAIYSAAKLLCADGAAAPATLFAAIGDYNHSVEYVETVVVLAQALSTNPEMTSDAATALAFVAAQLGVPYKWGGTGPGGFDCSGLVQAAYRVAGIDLPRVAQQQFDAGPPVPDGTEVQPGDLLFFGTSVRSVEHVGIYVGGGVMIDAPHTGTVVREESGNLSDFVGATRPA